MKAFHTPMLALAAALACGGAAAQLKLPSQTAPTGVSPRPAAAAAPKTAASAPAQATPEVKEKAAAATLAASGWLLLLDRRDWGRAWETSAAMFRSSVPLASWMDNIPKARDLGDFVSREPQEAIYKPTLEGRPNGDYVTVLYASKFSKKGDVAEIVTTVRDPDGKWRVTGYSTR
jgi:hypothetical protein